MQGKWPSTEEAFGGHETDGMSFYLPRWPHRES